MTELNCCSLDDTLCAANSHNLPPLKRRVYVFVSGQRLRIKRRTITSSHI